MKRAVLATFAAALTLTACTVSISTAGPEPCPPPTFTIVAPAVTPLTSQEQARLADEVGAAAAATTSYRFVQNQATYGPYWSGQPAPQLSTSEPNIKENEPCSVSRWRIAGTADQTTLNANYQEAIDGSTDVKQVMVKNGTAYYEQDGRLVEDRNGVTGVYSQVSPFATLNWETLIADATTVLPNPMAQSVENQDGTEYFITTTYAELLNADPTFPHLTFMWLMLGDVPERPITVVVTVDSENRVIAYRMVVESALNGDQNGPVNYTVTDMTWSDWGAAVQTG